MYRAVFTDKEGIRREFSRIDLVDVVSLFLNASMVEPFTVSEMKKA